MNLEVGQKLWFVPQQTRWLQPHHVAIVKIGRVWATLENRVRVDVKTLRNDAGYNHGSYHLSEQEWRQHQARERAWSVLQKFVRERYSVPPSVTIERICEASQLLAGDALVEKLAEAARVLDSTE